MGFIVHDLEWDWKETNGSYFLDRDDVASFAQLAGLMIVLDLTTTWRDFDERRSRELKSATSIVQKVSDKEAFVNVYSNTYRLMQINL